MKIELVIYRLTLSEKTWSNWFCQSQINSRKIRFSRSQEQKLKVYFHLYIKKWVVVCLTYHCFTNILVSLKLLAAKFLRIKYSVNYCSWKIIFTFKVKSLKTKNYDWIKANNYSIYNKTQPKSKKYFNLPSL